MVGQLEEEVNVMDRHLQALNTVIANEPIGIVKTAQKLDYLNKCGPRRRAELRR